VKRRVWDETMANSSWSDPMVSQYGEAVIAAAQRRGDRRPRCQDGHLRCSKCDQCACVDGLVVKSDRKDLTACPSCRKETNRRGALRLV
jgi:hypothetical protein